MRIIIASVPDNIESGVRSHQMTRSYSTGSRAVEKSTGFFHNVDCPSFSFLPRCLKSRSPQPLAISRVCLVNQEIRQPIGNNKAGFLCRKIGYSGFRAQICVIQKMDPKNARIRPVFRNGPKTGYARIEPRLPFRALFGT